jgi:hypothetical protein
MASSLALFAGCAAEEGSADESSAADLSSHSMSAAQSQLLSDLLGKAKAPSSTPAGITGVGSHVARIELTTVQGGIAHFISESGEVSTVGGGELGSLVDLGFAWSDVRDALMAGGGKFVTVDGLHGASSSTMLAKVECSQVVSPVAKPTCKVSNITITESDSEALMSALEQAKAPSNTPAGLLGVGSRIARIEVDTAQGGIAHFISENAHISTTDGKELASLGDLEVAWKSLADALLDGGLSWTTTQGEHGSSSSKMSATVECRQVVSPSAKPSCTISAL